MLIVFSILTLFIVVSSGTPVIAPRIEFDSGQQRPHQDFLSFGIPHYTGGSHTVNWGSWFCGAQDLQLKASHEVMRLACDEKMPEINACCAVHDSCYDNLVGGQENCDSHFCRCLNKAMHNPKPYGCQKLFTSAACSLVKEFGGYVYGKKNDDVRSLISYHPIMNLTASREYNKLYQSCQGFRKPLISCAYNHMVCTLKMLPVERYNQEYTDCRKNLITCLEESSEFLKMRNKESCSTQLDMALKAIKDDARLSGLPVELHYFQSTTPASSSTENVTTNPMEAFEIEKEVDNTTTEGYSEDLTETLIKEI
ncbi:unnamed protein product [Caenorhabditis brenneri]